MMFRVSSMYVHNRRIDVLLITAFIAEVASVIVILVVDYTARGTHSRMFLSFVVDVEC